MRSMAHFCTSLVFTRRAKITRMEKEEREREKKADGSIEISAIYVCRFYSEETQHCIALGKNDQNLYCCY